MYELSNLIISGLTAVGTCGATILALYFSLSDRKPKLICKIENMNGYGKVPNIEGGYFVIRITNRSYLPITIDVAGLKSYRRKFLREKCNGFMMFENTNDVLPKKLEFGQKYVYAIPVTIAKERLRQHLNEVSCRLYLNCY